MTPPTTATLHAPPDTTPPGPLAMLEHAHRALMLQRNKGESYQHYARRNGVSSTVLGTAIAAMKALEPFGGINSTYSTLNHTVLWCASLLDDVPTRALFLAWCVAQDASQEMAKRTSRMLRAGRPPSEALTVRTLRRPGRQKGEGFPPAAAIARKKAAAERAEAGHPASTPIANNTLFWAAAAETRTKMHSTAAIALTFMARAMAFEELFGKTLSDRERALLEMRVKNLHSELIESEKNDYDGLLT